MLENAKRDCTAFNILGVVMKERVKALQKKICYLVNGAMKRKNTYTI